MTDLYVRPRGREDGFSLRYENWLREAKVPILVLNATTLNTGHNWQFTASWMGEPPTRADEQVDASRRLRRVYYRDAARRRDAAAAGARQGGRGIGVRPGAVPAGDAAGASTTGIDVELVDGGVHDNQGIASLLDQDCTVILVSDASGQMRDAEHPKRDLLGVAQPLELRARWPACAAPSITELASLRRSDALRGLMIVHLKKGLPAPPRDWIDCQEPYRPEDDALARRARSRAYRIDPDVQRALAELRTDLDAFSDDEAYSLMAAGYEMTRVELGEALGDAVAPDPELERRRQLAVLGGAGKARPTGQREGLATALRPGRARFFRRLAARRLRRAQPTDGSDAPVPAQGTVRRMATAVATPVRMIIGAPLALVGGLVTRLVLATRRQS